MSIYEFIGEFLGEVGRDIMIFVRFLLAFAAVLFFIASWHYY